MGKLPKNINKKGDQMSYPPKQKWRTDPVNNNQLNNKHKQTVWDKRPTLYIQWDIKYV